MSINDIKVIDVPTVLNMRERVLNLVGMEADTGDMEGLVHGLCRAAIMLGDIAASEEARFPHRWPEQTATATFRGAEEIPVPIYDVVVEAGMSSDQFTRLANLLMVMQASPVPLRITMTEVPL